MTGYINELYESTRKYVPYLVGGLIGGSILKGRTVTDNEFSDWLYGDYNERKLRQFEALHNIPGLGNYMDYLLDIRADEEYLDRYGMDYTDIHDPRKLRSTNSGSRLIGSAMNYVSKNVERLYG